MVVIRYKSENDAISRIAASCVYKETSFKWPVS